MSKRGREFIKKHGHNSYQLIKQQTKMVLPDPTITIDRYSTNYMIMHQMSERYKGDLKVLQVHAFFTGIAHRLATERRLTEDPRYFRAIEKVGQAHSALSNSMLAYNSPDANMQGVDLFVGFANGANIKYATDDFRSVIGLHGFNVPRQLVTDWFVETLEAFGYPINIIPL